MGQQELQQEHKVKKGEQLQGIAKKFGHKSWKTIWDAPENKKVVQSRRQPEQIQPGDILVIPPNEKQIKEVQAKVAELRAERDAEYGLYQALKEEASRLQEKRDVFDRLIRSHEENTSAVINELNGNIKGLEACANAQAAASFVISWSKGLVKLSRTAYQASTASGKALEELNKKALKQVADMHKKPLKKAGLKTIAKLDESSSTPLAVIGILADSWVKMTSPSFWTNTYIQTMENGKSWSEAVQMKVGDDIRQQISEVTKNSAELTKKLTQRKRDIEAKIAENSMLVRDTEGRLKKIESEAAALPRI